MDSDAAKKKQSGTQRYTYTITADFVFDSYNAKICRRRDHGPSLLIFGDRADFASIVCRIERRTHVPIAGEQKVPSSDLACNPSAGDDFILLNEGKKYSVAKHQHTICSALPPLMYQCTDSVDRSAFTQNERTNQCLFRSLSISLLRRLSAQVAETDSRFDSDPRKNAKHTHTASCASAYTHIAHIHRTFGPATHS